LSIWVYPAAARGASETGAGSQANPYTSLSSLLASGFADNETILIRSGVTTKQLLQINSSSNFTLGTYGSGAAPIFDGSLVDANTWIDSGADDIWYSDSLPNGGGSLNVGLAYFADNVKLWEHPTLAALAASSTGQYLDNGGSHDMDTPTRIYVKLNGENPNTAKMEYADAEFTGLINSSNNGLIEGLEFIRANDVNLRVGGSDIVNMQVHDCIARDAGSWKSQGNGNFALYRSSGGYSLGVEFLRNRSYGAQNTGAEFGRLDGAVFENNYIEGCGMGYEMYISCRNSSFKYNEGRELYRWAGDDVQFSHQNLFWITPTVVSGDGVSYDNTFEFNTGIDTGRAIIDVGDDAYGNKFRNNTLIQPFNRTQNANSLIISDESVGSANEYENNILYAGTRSIFTRVLSAAGTAEFINNNYYVEGDPAGDYLWNHKGVPYYGFSTTNASAFESFKLASGESGLIGDPSFTSIAQNDFSLKAESTARFTGTDWWSPADAPLDASLNPLLSPPSMGANQYEVTMTLKTYGNYDIAAPATFGDSGYLDPGRQVHPGRLFSFIPDENFVGERFYFSGRAAGGSNDTDMFVRCYLYDPDDVVTASPTQAGMATLLQFTPVPYTMTNQTASMQLYTVDISAAGWNFIKDTNYILAVEGVEPFRLGNNNAAAGGTGKASISDALADGSDFRVGYVNDVNYTSVMWVEGETTSGGSGAKTPLAADSYFLLNINAGAKDVRQATGNWSGSFVEGDIGLKCGANIPLGNRQSVVGTVNVMKRYIMENLPAIRTAGSGAISCPVGGSYNDVVLTANTADLITIGLSGSARNGGTLFITETIGQLIDVWSQASTGN